MAGAGTKLPSKRPCCSRSAMWRASCRSNFGLVRSEVDPGLQHDDTRAGTRHGINGADRVRSRRARRRNFAETGTVDVCIRVTENRRVREIVDARANLQIEPFVDPDAFDEVHIDILEPGTMNGGLSQIAQLAGCGID